MAERYRSARHGTKRPPLSELRNRGNTPPRTQPHAKHRKVDSSSLLTLPHNESLEANGSLAVRSSGPSSAEPHRQVSQTASEYEHDSKRNSAISTTSTNASGRRRKTFIGHWQLGKTIGKGGCSRVRVVRHRYRDQYGAVKIITRSTAESTRAQSLANLIESTKGLSSTTTPAGHKPIPYGLEREIAVMKLLEHPNIVRLYDVWENHNELYLIMEYVDGGELFHYVDERKGLPEDETVYIFRQIVSALLYCHRLLICHRDLKPENILLNQRDLTVKLIDFGMAALQPEGRLLSTPCGSPHYAAPEVVSSKPYDGTQADVWSCGVILYVMLTGTTPYNYSPESDIRTLFRDIARAKYWMPPDLSLEAKDLIRRIFVPEPKKRITMDGVWDHPLLHKYDKRFGFEGAAGTKEAAIGSVPRIEQWKVKRVQDIDREILRNMRTLWHSEPEQSLIQKLLNDEYNQEKLFYAALVKHRDENLENYVGESEDMNYSASDYHHNQLIKTEDAPPMPPNSPPRSQSQYSIMNDEHLRPSHSFVAPTPSVSSYDPYRASRDPIVHAHGEYLNVTVHRQGSNSTRKASVRRNLRHPNSMRIEMLRQGKRRSGNLSITSLPRSGRSRPSMPRSSVSRNSMISSQLPSSPPVIATMRPSELHKRGVSFGHLRRTSTASGLISQATSRHLSPDTPCMQENLRKCRLRVQNTTPPAEASSPAALADHPIRSRKEKAFKLETPKIKVRKPDTPHQHIRSEIRKHSAELEKACEEAFFRSSVSSSLTAGTSFTGKHSPYDTPPSSVSAVPTDMQELRTVTRPLPALPKDTPNTYLTKTLEETREKLAAYKANPDENTAKFEEVMRMLNNIMPGSKPIPNSRIASAPEVKASNHSGNLPIISEESDQRNSKDGGGNWHRSVTAPVAKERKQDIRTIRVVPPSSPGSVAPLNVRKCSPGSQESPESQRVLGNKPSNETLRLRRANEASHHLAPIDEDTALATPTVVRKKRSGWLGLGRKDVESDVRSDVSVTHPNLSTLDDRYERRSSKATANEGSKEKALPDEPPLSAQSSEFPIRKKRFGGGRRGFAKWLGRKLSETEDDTLGREGGEFTCLQSSISYILT